MNILLTIAEYLAEVTITIEFWTYELSEYLRQTNLGEESVNNRRNRLFNNRDHLLYTMEEMENKIHTLMTRHFRLRDLRVGMEDPFSGTYEVYTSSALASQIENNSLELSQLVNQRLEQMREYYQNQQLLEEVINENENNQRLRMTLVITCSLLCLGIMMMTGAYVIPMPI